MASDYLSALEHQQALLVRWRRGDVESLQSTLRTPPHTATTINVHKKESADCASEAANLLPNFRSRLSQPMLADRHLQPS